jgi:RNA polymerase sigma factor (sigma-70 family)
MSHDAQLLDRYAKEGSEAAFAELVQRHVRLVFATALRQLGGDRHLAEDATQRVFADLARKASALSRHPTLAGWLFKSARYAAIRLLRQETRRKVREAKMSEDALIRGPVEASRERAWPALSELVSQLSERDRTAILLRFFEERSFAEIGHALGLSEDGARSRVDRTLDRLRRSLGRRGVAFTTALLAGELASSAAEAAMPPAFAASVTQAALIGAGVSKTASITGILITMNSFQTGIVAIALAASVLPAALSYRTHRSLDRDMSELNMLQSESAALRVTGRQLMTSLSQVGSSEANAAELVKIRQRVDLLRTRPDWVNEADQRLMAAAQNMGWDSADHAYETLMWAMAKGKGDVWEEGFHWRGQAKALADQAFAKLSDSARSTYGNADRFAGAGSLAAMAGSDPIVAYDAPIDPDAASARTGIVLRITSWNSRASGAEGPSDNYFYFDGANWTPGVTRFDPKYWDRFVSLLDPASAEK